MVPCGSAVVGDSWPAHTPVDKDIFAGILDYGVLNGLGGDYGRRGPVLIIIEVILVGQIDARVLPAGRLGTIAAPLVLATVVDYTYGAPSRELSTRPKALCSLVGRWPHRVGCGVD